MQADVLKKIFGCAGVGPDKTCHRVRRMVMKCWEMLRCRFGWVACRTKDVSAGIHDSKDMVTAQNRGATPLRGRSIPYKLQPCRFLRLLPPLGKKKRRRWAMGNIIVVNC